MSYSIKPNLLWGVFFVWWVLAFIGISHAEEVEKINVIGTRIKRTQVEGPSPILTIDKKQIERSGHHSMGDLLRDFPDITAGREHVISDLSSVVSADLQRGSALILINGQRMVPVPGEQYSDLSQIPLSVVEKIEVLKDGASAIYGAEAIGGVINIVTKQGEKGWEVQVLGSLSQRKEGNDSIHSFLDFMDWDDKQDWSGKGDRFNINAFYGGDISDINYLISGQLKLYAPLYNRHRSFSRPLAKHFSPIGSPGSWSDNDGQTWNPAPGCQTADQEGVCKFDYSPYMQLTPKIIQFSSFLQLEKPMGDSTLTSQTLYSLTRSFGVLAPPPDKLDVTPTGSPDYRIPQAVAQKLGLQASGPVTLRYRLVEEGQNREQDLWSHFLQTQAKLVKPVWNTWEFEGNLNIGGSYYTQTGSNYFNKETLYNMVNAGTFNPFSLSGKKSDVSSASYNPTDERFSGLISVEPQLSGELLEIKGVPISMALGTMGAWQTYSKDGDPISKDGKQWGGGVLTHGQGSRLFGGLYLEFSSLIANQLELQLAGRSDYYNDFGFAWQKIETSDLEINLPFSPKFSATYQPIDSLKFRSSFGFGFNAPSLSDMHLEGDEIGYPATRDYKRCYETENDAYFKANKDKPECTQKQYRLVQKPGNKELLPQYSRSFNLGLVLDPVDSFSLNLDYYYTSLYNVIGPLPLKDLLKLERKFGLAKVRQYNSDVTRYSNGEIKEFTVSSINLGRSIQTGLELGALLKFPIKNAWNLDIEWEHLHIIYEEEQATPDSEIESSVPFYKWLQALGLENGDTKKSSNLADYGNPRWRNRMTFSFNNQNLGQEWNIVLHNIPSQLKTHRANPDDVKQKAGESEEDAKARTKAENLVDYYWQIDVNASFELSKNSQIIAGVQNVFGFDRPTNTEVPLVRSLYLNSSIYSVRGRTIDVRYIYKF